MSKLDLHSAVAVISGASSGIGLEIARLLCLKYGCRVVGLARNEERLNAAAEAIGENFIPVSCDVTSESDRARLLAFLENNGIKPDFLINNAGILPPFKAYSPETQGELIRVTNVNYLAHTEMCALFLPLLLSSERGAIVNIASSAALAPLPGTAAYSASKSALLAFTEAIALEYKGALTVCCVCPGMTATSLFSSHAGAEIIDRFATKPHSAAKKILRGLKRGRKKIVIGADAHLMSAGNRLFGIGALKLFAFFIKIVKQPMFKNTFYK